MNTLTKPDTTRAIETVVDRYRYLIIRAASSGGTLRIATPETERPDLLLRGDGEGRAQLAICTNDGDYHVIFTHWPDDEYLFPENWPNAVPVPNYDRDPIP